MSANSPKTVGRMSASDFATWRRIQGLSLRGAASALGCAPASVEAWEKRGAPGYIGLACRAVERGLSPWVRPSLAPI